MAYTQLAVGIFPADAGTQVVTAVTTAISDNIGVILVLTGFSAGLSLVLHWFNKKAKVRA